MLETKSDIIMLISSIEPEKKSINKATKRVLDVLCAFIGLGEPLGPSELARRLGMTRNMVYRALLTLEDEGLLFRIEETGRYILSSNIAQLQNANNPSPNLRQIASPYLEKISEVTKETVMLFLKAGDFSVIIDGREWRNAVSLRVKLGRVIPLHLSVGSRAILASLDDTEIEGYLKRNNPLTGMTPDSITKKASLWKEIGEIRERGFALSIGDYSPTSGGYAYSLPDCDGRVHGAIGIGGPIHRCHDAWVNESRALAEPLVEELKSLAALYGADE